MKDKDGLDHNKELKNWIIENQGEQNSIDMVSPENIDLSLSGQGGDLDFKNEKYNEEFNKKVDSVV